MVTSIYHTNPGAGARGAVRGHSLHGLMTGTTSAAGGLLSVANPFGVVAIITGFIIIVDTAAGGAGTANFGVAANGTTSSDTILDGVDINATGPYNHIDDAGTNGILDTADLVWETSEFITGSVATGIDGSFVGHYVIFAKLGLG